MQIKTNTTKIEQIKTPLLAIGYFEDGQNKISERFDKQLNNAIASAVKQKEFTGEFLQTKLIHTLGRFSFDKLLLVGLGKQKELNISKLRRAAATAALTARNTGVKQYTTNLQSIDLDKQIAEKTSAVVESTILALYQFVEYKTIDKNKIKTIDIIELAESENAK